MGGYIIAFMTPLLFQLYTDHRLMIIPDTLAHLNGHTIITHTYSIFRADENKDFLAAKTKESSLHLDRIKGPDYYGYLTFEIPDKLITYTSDGDLHLNSEEVERLIEFLSDVRSNPMLWSSIDHF